MLKIFESIKCLQNKGQKRRQKLAIFEKSYLFGLKQSEVSKCQICPHNPQLTMKNAFVSLFHIYEDIFTKFMWRPLKPQSSIKYFNWFNISDLRVRLMTPICIYS